MNLNFFNINSTFKKNILKLFSATLISQITAILSSFVLAFYFIPDDLGEFSVVVSLSAILSILFTLRSEYPIVINSGNSNFSTFYSICITLTVFLLFLLLSMSLFLFKEVLFDITLSVYLITLFIALNISLIKVFHAYLTFQTLFGYLSISKVLQVSSIIILQLILFKLNINKPLILGFLIGLLINTIYLTIVFIKTAHFYKFKNIILCVVLYIKKFNKIIGIGSVSDIINSSASNMLPTLILVSFSKEAAGYYFFANRVLSLPLQLISASSASVYFQRASKFFIEKKFKKLKELTHKLEIWNGLVMLVIIVFITLFLDDILHIFFQNKWDPSLEFIYVLLPFFLIRSLFSPISNIMEILNRNDLGLYLNIFIILMNLFAIRYGNLNNDIILTITTISLLGSIGYLLINLKFLSLINKLSKK